jgi:hypothetical protein
LPVPSRAPSKPLVTVFARRDYTHNILEDGARGTNQIPDAPLRTPKFESCFSYLHFPVSTSQTSCDPGDRKCIS